MENNRKTGFEYEKTACDYLEKQGYEILRRNYRCALGEIDIIAQNGECLVFCEVKYRKNDRMGNPLEAVDARKQQKIRSVALWYMKEQGIYDVPIRFDVIGILGQEITIVKNAF